MPCEKATVIDLEGFVVDPRAVEWNEFREHYPRCADCSREVARLGALVSAVRLEASGASAHPTEQQLLTLSTSREQLRPEERERIAAHLAGCAPCRTELAVLTGFDWSAVTAPRKGPSWLERLRASLVVALPRPVFAVALAALVATSAYWVWRALSPPEAEVPQLARVEPEAKVPPAPVEVPEPPKLPPPETVTPVEEPKARAPEPRAAVRAPVEKATEKTPPPETKPHEPEPRPVRIAALLPTEAPRYAPGALAGSTGLRIGGTARSAGGATPVPQVLAPDHVGRTAHESPTLYWLLPEATPLPVEVTVADPNGVEPLLETTLPGPHAAGVHALRLAEHGVRLAPRVDYQWFVTIVADPARRSRDVASGAQLRYEPLAPEAAARLQASEPARLAHAYAEAGLWYDAFDQLSSWLVAEPDAAILHQHRAALLEQVGLAEAARYERGAEPGAK